MNPTQSLSTSKSEIVFTENDLSRICKMIYARAGIVLDSGKREMVYGRLSKRLRLHNLLSFKEYLDRLDSQPNAREWESFVNALTTNLTAFFREQHHFPILAEHIANKHEPVRIWCAAASTGEEPYSIAMTIAETLPAAKAAQSTIIATDIDTEALGKAISGIYPIQQVLDLGEERSKRFFLRGSGDRSGLARIRPEIASMVQFKQVNLHDTKWPITGPFDAIFCRNIMIYFDRDSQLRILKRFVPLLKPDGLFITGHSENFSFLEHELKLRGKSVYTLSKS